MRIDIYELKNAGKFEIDAEFLRILSVVGFQLWQENLNAPFLLFLDRAHLVKDRLEVQISESSIGVSSFMKNVLYMCSHKETVQLIFDSIVRVDADSGQMISFRATFMRLLLGISSTCDAALNIILEKIPESMDESIENALLSHLRCINSIRCKDDVLEKVMSCMPSCSVELQRKLLAIVPQLAIPENQALLLECLMERMEAEPELSLSVIEALSSLSLTDALRLKVAQVATTLVSTAQYEELPILTSFLLQVATKSDATRIIMVLRDQLNVALMQALPMEEEGETTDRLLIEAFANGFRYQSILSGAYIAALSDRDLNVHCIDIWILCILGGIRSYELDAKRTVTKLVKNGKLEFTQFWQSFKHKPHVATQFLYVFLSFATHICQNPSPKVRSFATLLYEFAFDQADNSSIRQIIVTSIIPNSGSSNRDEVDSSIQVLKLLAKPVSSYIKDSVNRNLLDNSRLKNLSEYYSLLLRMLDFVEAFSIAQIRIVFDVLCRLSVFAMQEGRGSAQIDELKTIFGKQLAQTNPRFHFIGIIGSLTISKLLFSDDIHDLEADAYHQHVQSTIELLHALNISCEGRPQCRANFFSELAAAVDTKQIPVEAVIPLQETLKTILQISFLEECDSTNVSPPTNAEVRTSPKYNLDGPEATIQLKLSKLLSSSLLTDTESLQYLCPLVRLLATTENLLHGCLEDIDAILGCPLLLPFSEDVDILSFGELSSDKQHGICISLFYAICWFRELVNSFAVAGDNTMQQKVLLRVEQIGILEDRIARFSKISKTQFPNLNYSSYEDHCLKAPKTLLNAANFQPLRLSTLAVLEYACYLDESLTHSCSPYGTIVLMQMVEYYTTYVSDSPFFEGDIKKQLGGICLNVWRHLNMNTADAALITSQSPHLVLHMQYYTVIRSVIQWMTARCLPHHEACATLEATIDHKRDSTNATTDVSSRICQLLVEQKDSVNSPMVARHFVACVEDIILMIRDRKTKDSHDKFRYLLSASAYQFLQSFYPLNVQHDSTLLAYFVYVFATYSSHPLAAVRKIIVERVSPFFHCSFTGTMVSSDFATEKYIQPLLSVTISVLENLRFDSANLNVDATLMYIRHSTLVFKYMVVTTKYKHKFAFVSTILKYGGLFVQAVLAAVPFMQQHIKTNSTAVSCLLKEIQAVTRRLHTLCAYGKENGSMLTSLKVPQVKKKLELLLYRVEEIIQAHGVFRAYSTGVLRSRNIDGTVMTFA